MKGYFRQILKPGTGKKPKFEAYIDVLDYIIDHAGETFTVEDVKKGLFGVSSIEAARFNIKIPKNVENAIEFYYKDIKILSCPKGKRKVKKYTLAIGTVIYVLEQILKGKLEFSYFS